MFRIDRLIVNYTTLVFITWHNEGGKRHSKSFFPSRIAYIHGDCTRKKKKIICCVTSLGSLSSMVFIMLYQSMNLNLSHGLTVPIVLFYLMSSSVDVEKNKPIVTK